MFNPAQARNAFPQIGRQIRGKSLIYLDSAATALKPKSVIDSIKDYYEHSVANIHRGAHFLGNEGTTRYEAVRAQVAKFLNAASPEEIVFTRGTTEGLNLIAQTLNFRAGDEILLTEMEHHSNIVPWQLVADKLQLKIRFAAVTESGEIDVDDFKRKLSDKTKMASFVHVSNALGTVNPAAELCRLAKQAGALSVIDAAQSATFGPLNVGELDCDFLVFSGHKVFAPTGIGVLYGKKAILETLPPYQGGGSMITEVTLQGSEYLPPPHRFEAGTQHVAGVIGLGAALEFMNQFDAREVKEYKRTLLRQAVDGLSSVSGLRWVGDSASRVNLVSFVIEGIHPSDLGQLLDEQGIAVRTGHHCCQPLMSKFGIPGTVRISFGLYNSTDEIEQLVAAVEKARGILS